jgi:hypothetical protein
VANAYPEYFAYSVGLSGRLPGVIDQPPFRDPLLTPSGFLGEDVALDDITHDIARNA